MRHHPRFEPALSAKEFSRVLSGLARFRRLEGDGELFFNSCSEAIHFYLHNIRKSNVDLVVAVPVYSCSFVASSVPKSGFRVKFIDMTLDEGGYHFHQDELHGVDVLIFIHQFGLPHREVDAIKSKFPNLLILEDFANVDPHDFDRVLAKNPAVFSFNFHKPLSCGIGGSLFLPDGQERSRMLQAYQLLGSESMFGNVRQVAKIIPRNIAYLPTVHRVFKKLFSRMRRRTVEESLMRAVVPRKISSVGRYLIGARYDAKRDTSYKAKYLLVDEKRRLKVSANQAKKLAYLPIFFKDKKARDTANKRLDGAGIDSYVLWEHCFHQASFYGGHKSGFEFTKILLDKVLFIPPSVFNDGEAFDFLIDTVGRPS